MSSVSALRQALERIPEGADVVRMFAKLGLWTAEAHKAVTARKAFPSEFSKLGPEELSDLSARVASDGGRIMELVGLLSGLEVRLSLRLKAARATARSKARRALPEDQKAPTKSELDDQAEEDPTVIELVEQMGLLQMMLAQATAMKDASQLYKEAVSREITYRGDQMKSRMY
jgi:hypothetical protein